jgi:predicted nucleic acid-binding Zn ribbon protein
MTYEYYCEECDKVISIEKSMKDTIPGFITCDTCEGICYRIWDNMAIKIPEHMKATSSLYNSDTGSNVDYIKSRRWGDADILNNYMNLDNKEVVETDLHLYYDIKCYGLAKDDCGSIMQELSRRIELNSSREAIERDIKARLFYTDNVRKFTVKRSTNIVEVHRLQIQLTVRDSLVDTLGNTLSDITIDTTITDGGLYRYPEDPSPLPIEIQAP